MNSLGMPRSSEAARLIDAIVNADEHLDADAFVTVLSPQGTFRFGGTPPLEGREAVRGMVAALFSRIVQLHHTIIASWESDAMLAYEGLVQYTLADATSLALPYFNVLRLSDALIYDYRIYIDPTPLERTPIGELFAAVS